MYFHYALEARPHNWTIPRNGSPFRICRPHDLLNSVLYRFAIRGDYGVQLLIWANKYDRIRIAHKMFDEGVFSRTNPRDGWKMVCSAIQNRDAAMVDLLQQNGINLIIKSRLKKTGLSKTRSLSYSLPSFQSSAIICWHICTASLGQA